MRMIARIGAWFDRRLQLAAPIRDAVEHPVPRNTASWWYVFGSAALVVFILQLVTGLSNVVLQWPLLAAVLHSGGAALMVWLLVLINVRAAGSAHTR